MHRSCKPAIHDRSDPYPPQIAIRGCEMDTVQVQWGAPQRDRPGPTELAGRLLPTLMDNS